jgi:hypothetical protein
VPIVPAALALALVLERTASERLVLRIAHRPVSVSLRAPPLITS